MQDGSSTTHDLLAWGRRLADLRAAYGLRRLARDADLTRDTILAVERAKRWPHQRTIEALRRVLGEELPMLRRRN